MELEDSRERGDIRFYEKHYPDKEELVMVKIERLAEMGAYVSLLEYNEIEGMILMSELSKQRIRSVNKIVRVGRHEAALVLRVDKDKGYIDLSKKRVSPEDVARCEDRYSRSKRVHQMVCNLARRNKMTVEELNKLITWPLNKKYGHALDALMDPNFSSTIVNELQLPPALKEGLVEDIKLRLGTSSIKMRVRVDVWCQGSDGVDAVKDALFRGKEAAAEGNPNADVKVKLIASPQYILITDCADRADGERRLNAALKAIETTIRSYPRGEAKKQGEFLVIGGEEEKRIGDLNKSEESSSESETESEEEDEGMGRVVEED